MASNQELLEQLGRSPEEIEAAENDPAIQFQMEVLKAARNAREDGAAFLALEFRLMEVLYGLYGLAIDAGELEDDNLIGEGDLDDGALHLLDVVGSSRRVAHRGVDEDVVRENLEEAAEILSDSDALEQFYN